jgi:hypothetical protein
MAAMLDFPCPKAADNEHVATEINGHATNRVSEQFTTLKYE